MARLIAFLACEKVITSDDNATSLIGIIQGYNIPVEPPRERVVLPLSLSVYALWERESDPDPDDELLQKIQLLAPDRTTVLIDGPETRVIKPDARQARFHRLTFNLGGLPILGSGDHVFSLLTRSAAEPEFRPRTSFPLPLIVAPAT
jgi:hypothetical protein